MHSEIFIPSYPSSWNESDAINACISGSIKFYFREVIKKKKWFCFYWVETGEIWKAKSGEFSVVNYKKFKEMEIE